MDPDSTLYFVSFQKESLPIVQDEEPIPIILKIYTQSAKGKDGNKCKPVALSDAINHALLHSRHLTLSYDGTPWSLPTVLVNNEVKRTKSLCPINQETIVTD